MNPSGKLRWRVPIGHFTYSSPLTLAAHRVIFGNHLGQMTTLDPNTGKLIGRDQGQGQLWTSAAVDSRGGRGGRTRRAVAGLIVALAGQVEIMISLARKRGRESPMATSGRTPGLRGGDHPSPAVGSPLRGETLRY